MVHMNARCKNCANEIQWRNIMIFILAADAIPPGLLQDLNQ